MNTEQDLAKCPFCGKAAYVSEPDAPSLGYEIGCPDNWGFKRGAHGHCNVAPAATGMTYAETAERWNRRSSDEQAEVVGYILPKNLAEDVFQYTVYRIRSVAEAHAEKGSAVALYASPPAVAAGGVTEALRSAMGMCEQYADFIRRVPAAEIDQHPYLPELEQVIEVARAALAVGDEGVREALARIIDANDDYLRHNPHGDPDALTVACDAARRFLPTPPSRGEGV